MAKPLPEKLARLIKEAGLNEKQATWDCHGTPVVLHKACEKMAAKNNIVFDAPMIIQGDCNSKHAVMCVTGHMGDKTEWSIGEAAPYNNKNNYLFYKNFQNSQNFCKFSFKIIIKITCGYS